jgi:prefoldin alpha subunit
MEQLKSVKQQLEMEATQLSTNVQTLFHAEERYKNAKDAVGQISKKNEGKEMLVPLTQSMYAPGVLADVDEVIVDLGTGYFAGKTPAAALEFVERKVRGVG